jgi:hypothetical protein
VKVTAPVAPKFLGDADWKIYHLPECRYAKFIDESKKVPFASAAEARAKDYIPCKVCKPELPGGSVATGKTPKTVDVNNKGDKPVALPLKDVVVPFKYKLVESTPDVERGVVRIDVVVDVEKPLSNNKDILLLAQKLVVQEAGKRAVNSVSIAMRSAADSKKWVCMVDWAPWGVLTRANEVKTGDYSNHKFYIYLNGYLKR